MTGKNLVVMFSVLLAVLTGAPGVSAASETQASAKGTFISIGGGGTFNVYGIGDGKSPTVQLGVGYRWSRLALDIDFIWNSLESGLNNHCAILFSGSTGCAHHLDGHQLGGIAHGRVYLNDPGSKLQFYSTIGVGGRVLLFESVTNQGFPVWAEDIKKEGSVWGVVIRAGLGVEFRLFSIMYIDMAGLYDLTIYEEMVDSEDGTTQNINFIGMLKFNF